jgi:hypothetical protein
MPKKLKVYGSYIYLPDSTSRYYNLFVSESNDKWDIQIIYQKWKEAKEKQKQDGMKQKQETDAWKYMCVDIS